MNSRFGIGVALATALIAAITVAFAEKRNNPTIFDALRDFRVRNNLSEEQLAHLLFDLQVNWQLPTKGGFALIDSQMFVIPNNESNEIKFERHKWIGKRSDQAEVVLSDGTKVLGVHESVEASKLVVVIFLPGEIRFVNYKTKTAGRLIRAHQL
ncbi:hypothetical protein BH11CYA1_BH11CYA1_45030 [soil metagenome]